MPGNSDKREFIQIFITGFVFFAFSQKKKKKSENAGKKNHYETGNFPDLTESFEHIYFSLLNKDICPVRGMHPSVIF